MQYAVTYMDSNNVIETSDNGIGDHDKICVDLRMDMETTGIWLFNIPFIINVSHVMIISH